MKSWKIIVVLLTFAVGVCSAQNGEAVKKAGVNSVKATLLNEANKDALRDSLDIDRIKASFIKALELNELSEIQQSSNLKRAAFQAFTDIMEKLEGANIPYPEYYAAAAFHAGNIQFSVGSYASAYTFYSIAVKCSPKNVEYLSHLAYMNENLNDPSKNRMAISNYKELIKLDPKESVYHLHLYYLYMNFNKFMAAKKELDTYTHTEGEDLNSLQPYLNIYDAMNKPNKGIEYIKGFIVRNPAYRLEGELYLSRYLLKHDKYIESFLYLTRNLDKLPTHDLPNLLNPYMQTLLEMKDTAEVFSFLDTLQSLHNDKLEVFQYSYDVRTSLGDTVNILPILQRMYELGKEDEQVYHSLAEYYQSNQMNEELYRLAVKGDSLFDNEIWTYYHIISSFDTASYERYIDVATKNVSRMDNKIAKSVIYTLLAESYGELCKRGDTAYTDSLHRLEFAAYDSALVYNPENSEALNNYAYILAISDSVTAEDLIRCERMAARAVKQDPSATHILDTYAWVLHLRGDNATARIYINKLIRIAEAKGDTMTVTEYYHIYAIFAPLDDPKAEEYLKLMREEYQKNPGSVTNDDKTRKAIEQLL